METECKDYQLLLKNKELIQIVNLFTRCKTATIEEAAQIKERMREHLSFAFESFSHKNDKLIEKLKGRFIDASVFRDKIPNAYIAVPDIVV